MKCFEYPIDTQLLLRKKRKIKKELLSQNSNLLKKSIAILGGSTTNEIVDQLDLFLLNYGIEAEFYQSEYGQYWQDAMFGNEKLDSFKPDIIIIHTTWRNITQFPTISNSEIEINALLDTEYNKFLTMWESIAEKYNCPIIQNNFERPNYRLLGNKDISDFHGKSNYISRLNQKFYEYAYTHKNFYINDIDYLSADYGLTKWSEPLYWHMYKYALTLDAIPILAGNIAKIIKAIYGKNKKALVLDLDNTLWGGIIGDDGVEGIAIGPEIPKGQVYSEFQQYCKDLTSVGVILAIDSKNDEANAIAGLNHPDSILHQEDFVSIKANWNPKNVNIQDIANELTLGADSFVFVDDNPAEQQIVSQYIPGISVPEIGSIENYITVLDHSGYFENITLSNEDIKKTELYKLKAKAAERQANFDNYDDYLRSLDMCATIKPFEPIYFQRIAQLTNKSNQFNLTTLRCSEDEISRMSGDVNYLTLYGKLEDVFGDNGLVSVVAGEIENDKLHIRLWLMSCRVLKRGLEDAMMNKLVEMSQVKGIKKIYGYYYATPKNTMVKNFYMDKGFLKIEEDENSSCWELDVDSYKEAVLNMRVR